MRTLISYSDLPALPASILGWGSSSKGFAEKALKDDLPGFHSSGMKGWGAHITGVPNPKILVPTLRWKIFPSFIGDAKLARSAMPIPVKFLRKTFGFLGVLFHLKKKKKRFLGALNKISVQL